MSELFQFQITTRLAAGVKTVWDHASSMEGITRELGPWVKMTFPRSADQLTPENVTRGKKLFRSWILLFGVLPVEYDDLVLEAIEPPRRFLERSTTAACSLWQHERILAPDGEGCNVTDRLALTPRVPGTGAVAIFFVKLLFTHRHRQLTKMFGG